MRRTIVAAISLVLAGSALAQGRSRAGRSPWWSDWRPAGAPTSPPAPSPRSSPNTWASRSSWKTVPGVYGIIATDLVARANRMATPYYSAMSARSPWRRTSMPSCLMTRSATSRRSRWRGVRQCAGRARLGAGPHAGRIREAANSRPGACLTGPRASAAPGTLRANSSFMARANLVHVPTRAADPR